MDKITIQHRDAIEAASVKVMKLLAANLDKLKLPDKIPEDNDMDGYGDTINWMLFVNSLTGK